MCSRIRTTLVIGVFICLTTPATAQVWREHPAPESEMTAQEETEAAKSAASALLIAGGAGFLVYVFTQSGVATAVWGFFVFLAASTHGGVGVVVGIAAVWTSISRRMSPPLEK
jgi:preprotein translocase subunit Sss1